MRLGRRQFDVLAAAEAGTCSAHHAGQGTFYVTGRGNDVHPSSVLDRLLDLGLVERGRDLVAGYTLVLTDDGRSALAAARAVS